MGKETLYFTHDFGARNDPKMINLQIKHGMLGIGCYWCLIEIMNEQGGEIPLEYERIGFELRIDTNVLKSIVNDFGLFVIEDNILSSMSVLRRMEIRNEKSAKARESINKRWDKYRDKTNVSEKDTNVPKNDTIKERKERKEKKETRNTAADDNFKNYTSWISLNCTNIQLMKNQMTCEQLNKALINHGSESVRSILSEMDNWNLLLKKNNSVYVTLENWIKRREAETKSTQQMQSALKPCPR